jgi:hypothetical protein
VVDEHVWHHVSTKPIADGGRGPKELTGMVDLSRDSKGKTRARLLDLQPGRSRFSPQLITVTRVALTATRSRMGYPVFSGYGPRHDPHTIGRCEHSELR